MPGPFLVAARGRSARTAETGVSAAPTGARILRALDRWMGVPLCFVLTLWRHVRDRIAPPPAGAVRRILFLKLTEQGSTVLAYPALRRAVEKVGRDNVHVVVFAGNRFILDVIDVVPPANVVAVPDGSLAACVLGLLRAVVTLRRRRLDAAVDLECFARSTAILAYLSGCRVRVGYHSFGGEGPWRGDLLTHRLLYSIDLHTRQAFEALVAALDASPRELPALDFVPTPTPWTEARFVPSADEVAAMRARLAAVAPGWNGAPLVLLHPSCANALPVRRWPAERYVELARLLLAAHPDLWIAFTGARAEETPIEALVRAVGTPRCFSMAGATTLRELLVLYGLGRVLVTSDGGPAHFASLTPIETVTLFGPETPRLFAAETARNHVLYAGLACTPSLNAFNGRRSPSASDLPMRRISTAAVFAVVDSLLRR
jgi:ADP-heptose:LPS heptosyltransferase